MVGAIETGREGADPGVAAHLPTRHMRATAVSSGVETRGQT